MNQNSGLLIVLRIVFGLYFIVQGIAQTDFLGKVYFPFLNNHFEVHYASHYKNSIPWKSLGIEMSANTFRQSVGVIIGLSGILLIIGRQLKIATGVMTVVGLWSVYAHILAGDPTYYAVCGGIIALVMAWMTFVPLEKEKTD
uniref:Uncharacterized protein LOC100180683 n=1 Tax=Phallusia mammillata TaxID=59560 RepID=A0A6F9DGR5_9ASCI|nr:uncharacterized protein LOC100180683 [Phallusia mammillata]